MQPGEMNLAEKEFEREPAINPGHQTAKENLEKYESWRKVIAPLSPAI
jgi:hypothetical protein